MPVDRNSLPKDPEILQQMLVDLTTQIGQDTTAVEPVAFGQKRYSQRTVERAQISCDCSCRNSTLVLSLDAATETQKDDDVPPGSTSNSSEDQDESRRRGRRTLPAHLKRERIEHDLAEEEKHCACCSQDLRPIGEESSERYESPFQRSCW